MASANARKINRLFIEDALRLVRESWKHAGGEREKLQASLHALKGALGMNPALVEISTLVHQLEEVILSKPENQARLAEVTRKALERVQRGLENFERETECSSVLSRGIVAESGADRHAQWIPWADIECFVDVSDLVWIEGAPSYFPYRGKWVPVSDQRFSSQGIGVLVRKPGGSKVLLLVDGVRSEIERQAALNAG